MKPTPIPIPIPIPDTRPGFSLAMLDTAKRRAVQLRQAAVDDAIDSAIRAAAALLRTLWCRLAGKEAVSCHS